MAGYCQHRTWGLRDTKFQRVSPKIIFNTLFVIERKNTRSTLLDNYRQKFPSHAKCHVAVEFPNKNNPNEDFEVSN